MKMYYEVKKIEQCSSCGDYLRNRRLVVYYKNEYVCQDCYMMMNHSEDKEKKEEAENAKRKLYKDMMRHIEGREEREEPVQQQEEEPKQEKKSFSTQRNRGTFKSEYYWSGCGKENISCCSA